MRALPQKIAIADILDSIADGLFTVDKEWHITSFNRAAEEITGIRSGQAVGRKCWEVFHADICEQGCLLKKTLKSGRRIIHKTVNVVDTRGEVIPISVSTALLRSADGKVIGGVETFRDLREIEELRKEVHGRHRFHDMVTHDHALLELLGTLPAIAKSTSPVLVLGESGTGKELLAKSIHLLSGRGKEPFVAVNCGALPETLLESELFGHMRGAFTDARSDKPGRFERAGRGTLFLDEIGELSRAMQVKLLRVLQEKVYEPLGAVEPKKSEARIIAATNRDLQKMLATGEFRQDLYYRINVVPLTLPPLRARQGDIPLLVEHFIQHYNRVYQKSISTVAPDAMRLLLEYSYPGNIRELENVLQHAFVLCRSGRIEKEHLPLSVQRPEKTRSGGPRPGSWEEFDRQQVQEALVGNHYSRTKTAAALGIHPATLWRKMKRYAIEG